MKGVRRVESKTAGTFSYRGVGSRLRSLVGLSRFWPFLIFKFLEVRMQGLLVALHILEVYDD